MTNPIEPAIERSLGAAEEIMWRLDGSSPMNCMASFVISGGVTIELLSQALAVVQKRHPNLRVNIREQASGPPHFYTGVSCIPVIPLSKDIEETDFIAKELLVPFVDKTKPLFCCFYQPVTDNSCRIFVKIHHAISDGMSVGFIIRDIADTCGKLARADEHFLQPLTQRPYFRDGFPKNTKGLVGFFRYLAIIWHLLKGVFKTGKPRFLQVNTEVPVDQRKLIILNKSFSPTVVDKVHKKALQEGTTVHGALYAAIVLAAAEDIAHGESTCIGCASSVNMRHKLNPPAGEDISYLVSVVGSPHRVSSKDDIWQLAREITQQAKIALDKGMDFLLMPLPYQLHAYVTRRLAHKDPGKVAHYLETAHNPPCIVLTNVGRLSIELKHPPFWIEDINFYANPSVLTPFGSIALTMNNTLKWTLIGSEPVVTKTQLVQVFANAEKYLLSSFSNDNPCKSHAEAEQCQE